MLTDYRVVDPASAGAPRRAHLFCSCASVTAQGLSGRFRTRAHGGRTVLPLMRIWLCAVSFKHFEDLFGVHVPALAAFAQVAQLEYGFL